MDDYQNEIINHITNGIKLYQKYYNYSNIDKVVLYRPEPGVLLILLTINGIELQLDLNDPSYDKSEEDRAVRREWVFEDECIYYSDELDEMFAGENIQEICTRVAQSISCPYVTYEEGED